MSILHWCLGVGLVATVAATGEVRAERHATSDPPWSVLSPVCAPYARVTQRDPGFWDARLSLASCTMSFDDVRIDDLEAVEEGLAKLLADIVPAIDLYRFAIEHAPDRIRYRAAYQLALATVAYVTAARNALPRDASPRLRAELERHLARPLRAVRVVLEKLEEMPAEEPELVCDPVGASIAIAVHRALARWPANDPAGADDEDDFVDDGR